MALPHPAFQRLVKAAQAEREQIYGQGPDHRMYRKAELVRSPLHIPDQHLMDQKTVRGQPRQPQKRLCGKQPGNDSLAHGKQPDQQHRRGGKQHIVPEGHRAQNPHLLGGDKQAAARKQHSGKLQQGESTARQAALLFAAVVKAAHAAADGKISRPEHRAQIGQVKGDLSAEPDFPENKGRKTLHAEDYGGNATQPAGIGLFQYGEKRGKDGIQKSLYRKIPRHSVQAEPETAGGNPCLQQKNAYNKLRCTGEHPAGRGLRQKPLQHK